MSHGVKISNEYACALGQFYADTPKAVFAAIAYSFADRLMAGSEGTTLEDLLKQEWRVLHDNGIISQKPKP